MRILLVLLIILGMIAWNKGWIGFEERSATVPVAAQAAPAASAPAAEPGKPNSITQWFVDHTPKK